MGELVHLWRLRMWTQDTWRQHCLDCAVCSYGLSDYDCCTGWTLFNEVLKARDQHDDVCLADYYRRHGG